MDQETKQRISETVNAILNQADLKATTEQSIRKQASTALGLKLSAPEYKGFVRSIVDSFLVNLHANAAALSEPSGDEAQTTATQVVVDGEEDENDDDEVEVEVPAMESAAGDLCINKPPKKRKATKKDIRRKKMISIRDSNQAGKEILTPAGGDSSSIQTDASASTRLVVTFDKNGHVVGNKNKLLECSLDLIKSHISLYYDKWSQVPESKKDDIWDMILMDFDISIYYKRSVQSIWVGQLSCWRKNLRTKYFQGLDGPGIYKMREMVPQKEQIPIEAWRAFVDRESSEEKMAEKARNSGNRAKKTDVHCLGRKSYAEISQSWTENGIEHEPVDLYLHARKQPSKNGAYHPKVVASVEKVIEIRKSCDKSSPVSLNECFGNVDHNGRKQAVCSKVSKTKSKQVHVQPPPLVSLPPELRSDQRVRVSDIEAEIGVIKKTLDGVINIVEKLGGSNPASDTRATQSSTTDQSNLASISGDRITSTTTTLEQYMLFDVQNRYAIAEGHANPVATPGAIVHGRPMQEYERKVFVFSTSDATQEESLYLGNQGSATTIGQAIGDFVVWPVYLLHKTNRC